MAFVGVTVWLASTAQAQAGHESLLLEAVVNSRLLPEVVRAELRADGSLWLEQAAWERAGLAAPAAAQALADGTPAHALTAIQGLHYQLDRANLRLQVQAPARAFASAQLDAQDLSESAAPAAPAAPGLMVSYDAFVQTQPTAGPLVRGATLEAVGSGPWGHAVTSALLLDNGSTRTHTRLETYWRRDLPERMETLVLGDTVGTSGGWSRPVRYAGLRWGRDFGLRPGFVTQPTLALAGEAALPSTVDVLVNNQRRPSTSVQPGPFDLRNLPPVSGAGQVNLVVRDLLGRESVISQSFYASPRLLAPGLTDFSLEAGALRQGFGQDSHYGARFAAFSWRQGLAAGLTAEARAEVQPGRRAAGLDLATLLGTWAIARGSLALSQGQDAAGRGQLWQLGLERSATDAGFSLQWLRANRGFAPFGESPDPAAPADRLREQRFAALYKRLGGRLFGGLSYARQARWSGDTQATLGLSASLPLSEGASLSMSVNRQLAGERGWHIGLFLHMVLGERRFASASANTDTGRPLRLVASASQAAPVGPGVGWRVEASNDALASGRASVQLQAERLEASLDLASDSHAQVATRAGLRGTLGWLGGQAFASRPVGHGSMVLVETGEVAGVPVLRSNQRVAVTDANGRALVPGLMPWLRNRIEIDGAELPMDVSVSELVKEVVPPARGGAVLRFDLRRSRQALVLLRLPDGRDVPAGAQVTTLPQQGRFPVGLRGEAWLGELQAQGQRLQVRWTGGACTLVMPSLDAAEVAPTLGPLTCVETAP